MVVMAAALATTALSLQAAALSIGEPQVLSNLGEPLRVRVPILDHTAAGTVQVSLLPAASYDALALIPPPTDRDITGRVVEDAGQTYFWVESARVITEPVFDLAIEAVSRNFVSVRHVTVLLDPPVFVPASDPVADVADAAAIAQRAPPVDAARPSQQRLSSRTVGPAVAGSRATTYGPVRRGETLSQIAEAVRPAGTQLWPYVAALAKANPGLVSADGTNLVVGSSLRLPGAAALGQLSDTDVSLVLAQSHASQALVATEPAITTDKAAVVTAGAVFDSRQTPTAATRGPVHAVVAASVVEADATAPNAGGSTSVALPAPLPKFSVDEALGQRSLRFLAANPEPAPSVVGGASAVAAGAAAAPIEAKAEALTPPASQSLRAGWPWWLVVLTVGLSLAALYGLVRLMRDLAGWLAARGSPEEEAVEQLQARPDAAPARRQAPTPVAEPQEEAAAEILPNQTSATPSAADGAEDKRTILREIESTLMRTTDRSLRTKLTLAEAMAENGRLDRARGLMREVVAQLPDPTAAEQVVVERWSQRRTGSGQ